MCDDSRIVKTLLCSSPRFDCRLKGWVGAQVVMLALEVNECVPSVVLLIVPHYAEYERLKLLVHDGAILEEDET